MEFIYEDFERMLVDNWEGKGKKFDIRLAINVDTGNVPMTVNLHHMIVDPNITEIFQLAGIWHLLNLPTSGEIDGLGLDILYRGLVHMCSHSEIYLQGPIDQEKQNLNGAKLRQAISMLASFIYECQRYPKAHIECFVLKEDHVSE